MIQEQVEALTKEIQEKLKACNMVHGASPNKMVTMTQGVFFDVPHAGQIVRDFIHSADIALYKAKEEARGTIRFLNYKEKERKNGE